MLHLNPAADEKEDARGPQVTAACTEGQGGTLAESPKVSRLTQETFSSHFQLTTKPLSTFPDLHTALATCAGRAGAQQHSITISHFMARQKNWGKEATTESHFAWVMLHRHLGLEPSTLPDIYFAPVQWVGNYSQQPWSKYIWTWGGTGKGRAPKCHRGRLPSHFTCGLMHAPCLISPFKSTIHILFGCYNQSVVHITHHQEI